MANLCNGTQKIQITSGMHIGNTMDCPGCGGCRPKQLELTPIILTPEEVVKNLRERTSGGWKD